MILRVRHVMACAYESPVVLAAHLLHVRPRALACQRVLGFALAANPAPSRQRDGADHFGNPVTWMFHDEPHTRFEVASEANVELLPRPAPAFTPPWEQVADAARNQAWAWREAEFKFPSPFAPALPEARQFATPSFPPGRPIGEAAACLARRIGQEFRIQPATAYQDPVHAMMAGLRGFGIPARYTYGYRLAPPSHTDQLHAWAGCWLGPGLGWLELDPACCDTSGQDRVCVGWGRDRGDLSPMRGVLFGEGTHVLRVSVSHEPVAEKAGE